MSIAQNGVGHNSPFFPIHFTLENIAAADFDPITTLHDALHPVAHLNASEVGRYSQKGFLARPNADGDLWVITWEQWHEEGGSSFFDRHTGVAIVPVCWNGMQNQWCEIPVVKVYSHSDNVYPATATEINVGIIL